MSDNLDDIPLPEPCTIEDKLVSTRKNLVEEQDGNLFNRKCDNLDNTIPKRKDRFIECEELPEVPKVLLKNKQFNEVEFPGVPLAEIPKKLLAHLLPCCLEGRSAGFDFEVEEELDNNGNKVELDFEDTVNPVTKSFTIQLGTEGFSYFRIGLNIKPELCFCNEECGDRDYIHLKVNLGVEYHDDDDDHVVQDPDLTIEDEQLSNLLSNFGGGGGNPLCSQKMFAQYDNGWFSPMDNFTSNGYDFSENESTFLDAEDVSIAPYLHNLTLTSGGIYKLEFFCEYNKWVVTDGECPEQLSSFNTPKHHETVNKSGDISGEFNLSAYLGTTDYYTVNYNVGTGSNLIESEAFSSVPVFDTDLKEGTYNYLWYTATVNSNIKGIITYNIGLTSPTTNKVYSCKIVFHIDTTEEETEEEEGEETET